MNCEIRSYQVVGSFYNGEEEEQELSYVRCGNPRAVRVKERLEATPYFQEMGWAWDGTIDGSNRWHPMYRWVCWQHLHSEYGFETSAVLE